MDDGRPGAGRLHTELRAGLRDLSVLLPRARLSARALALRVGASNSAVSTWLKGEKVPQDRQQLVRLVAELRARPPQGGWRPDELELLDTAKWRDRHAEWTAQRQLEAERQRHGRQAAVAGLAAERLARRQALADRPRPLGAWDARRLRVHPALPGSRASGPGFVLPAYVPRAHDQELRTLLGAVAAGPDAALIVVRGGSCSGKTRAAYEALRAVPQITDWNLVFPGTAESALAVLAAGAVDARTVLWLDDAHSLLEGVDGQALAAALRSRLNETGPALVLATIWGAAYDRLTRSAPTDGRDDPHAHTRALLTAAVTVDVPGTFTAAELEHADSTQDLSLRAARRSGARNRMTQTLAAGIQLLDRYDSATEPPACYGRALVTAAMDATRFGWDTPLPQDFLRDAAPGYLTDEQRAVADPDEWFGTALALATEKIERTASALEAVPRDNGMGRAPGVWRLTDFLDAHGRTARGSFSPPPSFWQAAARHVTSPRHALDLAHSAMSRLRYRAAEELFTLAAEGGEHSAYTQLTRLRELAGEPAEADRMALDHADAAAAAPGESPCGQLVRDRVFSGDWEGAERLARAAAEAGTPDGCSELARGYLWYLQDLDRAEKVAQLAAGLGDVWANRVLMEIRVRQGDWAGAEHYASAAAEGGGAFALQHLAEMHADSGSYAQAARLAEAALDRGDTFACRTLATVRENQGDGEGAERIARSAAERYGDLYPLELLAVAREQKGDHAGADILARRMADSGSPSAYRTLSRMREEAGRHGEAEKLAQLAADLGNGMAFYDIAELRESAGDLATAEQFARRALETQPDFANRLLARLREKSGDRAGAEDFARAAAEAGDPYGYSYLAELRLERGDREGADRMIRAAADAGDGHIFTRLPRPTPPTAPDPPPPRRPSFD